MSKALDEAYRVASAWIDGLNQRSVLPQAAREDLESIFRIPLPETGLPPEEVTAWLAERADAGIMGSASGRFFAWVVGGAVESAVAADWMVATWDQNAVIEEVAGQWLKELLGLPADASFAFTTGCQMAHVTALAAARHSLLHRKGWDVEENGLGGAPPVTLIVNDQRHGSIERAARYLGFGRRALVPLPTEAPDVIAPDTLAKALKARSGPIIVVLNAANLNTGASDPFAELIPMAHQEGAWVHIDGAFGLFARASRKHRHHLNGVELADSWATDGHKWLNVPFDCGVAIVRDHAAHRAAMTLSASYIESETEARDQIDWNPEWSRRARGIPVYAAIKELGRRGIEELIDRCCAHCEALVSGIGTLPGAEILHPAILNQGLVRFRARGQTSAQDDAFTDMITRAINATGEAYFSTTTWRGQRAMRISVVNWRTTSSDVARAIKAARTVLSDQRNLPA
jgi:glutamate/tyrosine decarboxylase-like PLP-dependent enzyme